MAEAEFDFENQLDLVNSNIESTLKFKLIPYKEDIWVLSEFDIVQS